jgi:hypothetical protein
MVATAPACLLDLLIYIPVCFLRWVNKPIHKKGSGKKGGGTLRICIKDKSKEVGGEGKGPHRMWWNRALGLMEGAIIHDDGTVLIDDSLDD